MKKGFTIVELLMVIGIIGILLSIVTTAASSSIKMARSRKAEALCSLVQTGLATYHAQKGKWPVNLEGKDGNYTPPGMSEQDPDIYQLTGSEVRECVKALVEETRKDNPLIDVSGLFVSRSPGESNDRGSGLDFLQAIHGTRKSSKKMKLAEMYFGYPTTEHGWFRRFKMLYSLPGDSIKVQQQ